MEKMTDVDPRDFIITRKRKKYKFAKFANAKNCFELSEWLHLQSPHLQGSTSQITTLSGEASRSVGIVEIGAGTGLFVVELASRHPEKVFVAIDVKADRLQKGAYEALERGLTNIYFIRARADQIGELFVPGSLETIWLTFSDPFPKKRSAGRRMTHPTFLKRYRQLLGASGRLLVKHDNLDFFQWTLEQLVADDWRVNELSFDLHESDLSDDYKILTTYEQRWLGEGRTTQFVAAKPN